MHYVLTVFSNERGGLSRDGKTVHCLRYVQAWNVASHKREGEQ